MPYSLTTATPKPHTHSGKHRRLHSKPLTPWERVQVSGHRYYSPELGRWLRRDPIGESEGVGLFAFCDNSPMLSLDYLGLWRLNYIQWLTSWGAYKWSSSDKGRVEKVFKHYSANIDRFVANAEAWLDKADSTLPEACAYKDEAVNELLELRRILVQMRRELNGNRKMNLKISMGIRNLGSSWWWGLSKSSLTFRGTMMWIARPVLSAGGMELRSTIFHELTHIAGVPGDDPKGRWVEDAQAVDLISPNPEFNIYQMIMRIMNVNPGTGDACCPDLS